MEKWFERIEAISAEIRAGEGWSDWRLKSADALAAPVERGAVAIYAYSVYVERFILIMCSVLSTVPSVDERFWRLADNLHDELGGREGLRVAHARLIAEANDLPAVNEAKKFECQSVMRPCEERLFVLMTKCGWPLNLFALGPATESISDLFLVPLEYWGRGVMEGNARLRRYFDVHRPEVEIEHQMEIARVLASELSRMEPSGAEDLFMQGSSLAREVAALHLEAIMHCWKLGFEDAMGTQLAEQAQTDGSAARN